jgi:hypothetical protein
MQQQRGIIDACEKYRTRVSFIQHDLRRSEGILSNRRNDDASASALESIRLGLVSNVGIYRQSSRSFYFAMAQGNRLESIFRSDQYRHLFLKTLGEVCGMTGWRACVGINGQSLSSFSRDAGSQSGGGMQSASKL